MASKLYDNAYLDAKKPGKDFTVDILKAANKGDIPRKKRAVDAADPGVGGDPVAEARAFLDKPYGSSVTQGRLTPQDEAELAARLDWNAKNQQEGTAIQERKKGGFRRTTEGLSKGGDMTSLGSLATMPMAAGGPVGAIPSAALMAMTGLLHAPDQLRRAYAPQDDENQPSVMEALGTGLEMSPLSALGRMGTEVAAGEPLVNEMAGSKVARQMGPGPLYENEPTGINPNFQRASNPNQVLGVARDVVNESGTPLQDVLRGGRKAGLGNKPSVDALMKLAESGDGYKARITPPAAPKPSLMDAWYARNPPGEGRMTGQFVEGDGGMHDLAQGRIQPTPLTPPTPVRPLQGAADDILEGVGPEADLSPFINAESRLAQLSRQRAYGQAFRAQR